MPGLESAQAATPSSGDVFVASGVCKRFGGQDALTDVSLRVAPGERVALLGHNGAGKTTLMKIALGLIPATSGELAIDGARPGSAAARERTAYLPEAVSFHRALTGREQLALFARLAGEPSDVVDPLLERVGLGGAANRRIGGWSKGMRQRLGLAQTLLGRPRFALLDEPTSGLDPISRHELYAIIDEIAAQGAAVLISSHALTELEARTDRIAILRDGRLVADDTLAQLRAAAQLPIRFRLTSGQGGADEICARFGGARLNGAVVEFACPPEQKMEKLAQVTALGAMISDVEIATASLEDLYRHFAQRSAT